MRTSSLPIFILALALLDASPVLADHPTVSIEGGGAGPVTTISAVTLPKGTLGASVQTQMIFNDEISDRDLRRFSLLDEDIHSTESVYSLSLTGSFAVGDDFTLGLSLPYISRKNIRSAGHHEEDGEEAGHHDDDGEEAEHHEEEIGTVERLGDSDGIGDMTVYGKFRFHYDEAIGRHAALIAGIKTPTGRTDVRTIEGELFETEHQPGSGSWDPFVGLVFAQQFERWSLDANVLYTFASEGSQDTNLGDIFNYNLAASYRLSGVHNHLLDPAPEGKAIAVPAAHGHAPIWDLIFEANGDWRDMVEVADATDHNTGGNLVYLSAGTRMSWGEGWSATFSAGVPILKDLNGIQSEPKVRLLLGISKGF